MKISKNLLDKNIKLKETELKIVKTDNGKIPLTAAQRSQINFINLLKKLSMNEYKK